MATSLQEFLGQLMPLYPELVIITFALTVLLLDFLVDRQNKAILGWYSLIGIVIATVMTVTLMESPERSSGGPSCSTRSPPISNWPSMLPAASASWSR
jgi:NADH:ubiquinone oxidoreductase subunit 2 (subunit N)